MAAGTVFLHVLVWVTPEVPYGSWREGDPGATARMEQQPLLRLVGHQGSIHRCEQCRPLSKLRSSNDTLASCKGS